MSDDRLNCAAHTGQEERIKGVSGKMTLVIWLLAILIAGVGGLYTSIISLNNTLATIGSRFAAVDARLTIIEANDQRAQARLDRLELETRAK